MLGLRTPSHGVLLLRTFLDNLGYSNIGVVLGLSWDSGKQNGKYYLGFRCRCKSSCDVAGFETLSHLWKYLCPARDRTRFRDTANHSSGPY